MVEAAYPGKLRDLISIPKCQLNLLENLKAAVEAELFGRFSHLGEHSQ